MGLQGLPKAGDAANKMTVRQACHVLALIGDSEKYEEEESDGQGMKVQLWRTRDLDRMAREVGEGTRDHMAPWPNFGAAFAPAATTKSTPANAEESAPGDDTIKEVCGSQCGGCDGVGDVDVDGGQGTGGNSVGGDYGNVDDGGGNGGDSSSGDYGDVDDGCGNDCDSFGDHGDHGEGCNINDECMVVFQVMGMM